MSPDIQAKRREFWLRRAEASAAQADLKEHEASAKQRAKDPMIALAGRTAAVTAERLRKEAQAALCLVVQLTDYTDALDHQSDEWRDHLEALAAKAEAEALSERQLKRALEAKAEAGRNRHAA